MQQIHESKEGVKGAEEERGEERGRGSGWKGSRPTAKPINLKPIRLF